MPSSSNGSAASSRVTSGYCSIHIPVKNIVAGTCSARSSSINALLSYDLTFPLTNRRRIKAVKSASNVNATRALLRGPCSTTGMRFLSETPQAVLRPPSRRWIARFAQQHEVEMWAWWHPGAGRWEIDFERAGNLRVADLEAAIARWVHGITDERVADAPPWADVLPKLLDVTAGPPSWPTTRALTKALSCSTATATASTPPTSPTTAPGRAS